MIEKEAETKDIYFYFSFQKRCRAVAQLGRASEPASKLAGGDAVDAYLLVDAAQPTERTETGVSQEG